MERFDGSLRDCLEEKGKAGELIGHLDKFARNQLLDRIAQARAAPARPSARARLRSHPRAQVAARRIGLWDIKPDNILIRKYRAEDFAKYPLKGKEWNKERWGDKVDIRMADFDAGAHAPRHHQFRPDEVTRTSSRDTPCIRSSGGIQ